MLDILIDSADIFGATPSTEPEEYSTLLAKGIRCRLENQAGNGVIASGVGGVEVSAYRLLYSPEVTLPDGYWQMEIAGTRYVPRANSSVSLRDPRGRVMLRRVDLDQIGPNPH